MNFARLKIYVINMEKSLERKASMQKTCEDAGLEVEFFKAITPETLHTVQYNYAITRSLYKVGRQLKPQEIGCACSHIQLWRKLQSDNRHDSYLILEDDVVFHPQFKEIIANLPQPKEPHLIRFFGIRKRKMLAVATIQGDFTLNKMAEGPLLSGGYIINKSATTPLLKYCTDMFFPIDNMMDHSAQHGVANYCIQPYPITSDYEDNSTIGERAKKYSVKNNFTLRMSVRIWRLYFSICKRIAEIKLLKSPLPRLINPQE